MGKYSKVTITIEESDGSIEVIEIPMADHIRIDTRGIKQECLVGIGPTSYLQTSMDLEIALTGNFDTTEGCIFRKTTMTTAKELKKDG